MSKPEPGPAATSDVPDKWGPSAPPEGLDRLRGRLVPFDLVFFEEVGSTNDAAAAFVQRGDLRVPAVVAAGRQTAGRGTRGRTWHSGHGSLTATFVLPAHQARPIHHLPIAAGLAVREAVIRLVPAAPVKIKWPNDLQLAGRKLAGLLCERKGGVDLVGVGMNVALPGRKLPPQVRKASAALAEIDPAVERWPLLAAIAEAFAQRLLGPHDPQRLAAQWRRADALPGAQVEIDTPAGTLRGRADGIDADGRLCLVGADGQVLAISSGTVRRPSLKSRRRLPARAHPRSGASAGRPAR